MTNIQQLHVLLAEALRCLADEQYTATRRKISYADVLLCELEGSIPDDGVPWAGGPTPCTNCGESARPHPAYADFVGPFCDGCWEKLVEFFAVDPVAETGQKGSTRE